jgi:hypothetical protein
MKNIVFIGLILSAAIGVAGQTQKTYTATCSYALYDEAKLESGAVSVIDDAIVETENNIDINLRPDEFDKHKMYALEGNRISKSGKIMIFADVLDPKFIKEGAYLPDSDANLGLDINSKNSEVKENFRISVHMRNDQDSAVLNVETDSLTSVGTRSAPIGKKVPYSIKLFCQLKIK